VVGKTDAVFQRSEPTYRGDSRRTENMKKIRMALLLVLWLGLSSYSAWADQVVRPTGRLAFQADESTEIVKVYGRLISGGYSQGTGWFINSTKLITDYHVIKNCTSIWITYPDGKWSDVIVLRINSATDLASLEVIKPRADQAWLTVIDDSDTVSYGEKVTASGYPHDKWAQTAGTLTERYVDQSGSRTVAWMSSDLVLDHGGSGSPITNSDRIVIGIAESITKPGLPYRCMIISANVIWEALGLTSTTTHANGFYTGVTLGLDFSSLR